MKKIIRLIKGVINARQELSCAKSWVKYLEDEVNYLYQKQAQDNTAIMELVRENEILCGENTKLIKEVASARSLANRVRDNLHATAATPKEHEFLRVCADIYGRGKMIKGRTFATMMGAAIRERRNAVKGRSGVCNETGAVWPRRVSKACDSGVKKAAAAKQ